MEEVEGFKAIIKQFENIEIIPVPPPTFMELAGYPHYENVCSNILCFYFNTHEQHKLGNLFLRSLLECLNENQLAESVKNTTDVYREDTTENKKRIDLIIESDETVIAIENKIFHHLDNDLMEYKSHIDRKFPSVQKKIFVVLSIHSQNKLSGSFTNVTYSEFLSRIKINLGDYAIQADNKYFTFLLDFIETIQNHFKPLVMNIEMFNFVADNYISIESLQAQYKFFNSQLYNVVFKLSDRIPNKGSNVNKWIWEKYVIVHDFTFDNNIVITVDCAIEFKFIDISVFVRKGDINHEEFLKKLELFSEIKEIKIKADSRVELFHKDVRFYEINEDEILNELNRILDKIKLVKN